MECRGYKCRAKDSDRDGVADVIEERIGTNKNKIDSDGDSLSDFMEHYKLGSNPALNDTDFDDIRDDVDPEPVKMNLPWYRITMDQPRFYLNSDTLLDLKNYLSVDLSQRVNRSVEKDDEFRLWKYPDNDSLLMEYEFNVWMRNTGVFDLLDVLVSYNVTYNCTHQNATSGRLSNNTVSIPDLTSGARIYLRFTDEIKVKALNEAGWRKYVFCPNNDPVHNVTVDKVTFTKAFKQTR
jgi:hypothetical protein